jgi:hypothetical protein
MNRTYHEEKRGRHIQKLTQSSSLNEEREALWTTDQQIDTRREIDDEIRKETFTEMLDPAIELTVNILLTNEEYHLLRYDAV